jgi:hypothetical protein
MNEAEYTQGRLNMEKNDSEEMCRDDEKKVQLKVMELEQRRKTLTERESRHLKQ